jgi:DNA-binding protein H-NS
LFIQSKYNFCLTSKTYLNIHSKTEAAMSNYAKLQAQIEQLQKEADSIRGRERVETIANIKKAIALFDLTAAELGLSGTKGGKGTKAGKGGKAAKAAKAPKTAGLKRRGRPAKAGAKKLGRPPKTEGTLAADRKVAKKAGKKARKAAGVKIKKSKGAGDGRSMVAPKYRDSATGITWTGRGKQPKWVVAAIASGKTLADLKI